MGVRHSREQWFSWVVDQRSSGLTIAAFCDSIGLKENSFYRWRAKLIAEGESFDTQHRLEPHAAANAISGASVFVPLTVVSSERITIDLPCGAVVRVPSDEASVTCVLRVLLDVTTGSGDDAEGGAAC